MGEEVELQPTGATSGGVMGRVHDMISKAKNSAAAKTNKGFMGLLTNNKITLKNLLLSAVVVVLELLLSKEVFECPLNNHKAYGTWFLVAPFFIVFFANMVILGGLSQLTDRCCVTKYCRWGECSGHVLPNTMKACVGPFAWLIASFADTTYYVCSEVGQPIEKRNLTNETAIKILEQEFADAKSTSHTLAWLFFLILAFATSLVIMSKRCVLKDDKVLENLDPFILEKREAFKAMETFHERTRDLYNQDNDKKKNKEDKATASVEAGPTNGSTEVTNPDPPDPSAITRESVTGDNNKDKEEQDKKETDPFLPKDEEITLYPHGAPELFGQKRVEKLFENWSKQDKWHYLKAYEAFAGMYPRIATGKPWKPWVSDSIANDNILKEDTSPPS